MAEGRFWRIDAGTAQTAISSCRPTTALTPNGESTPRSVYSYRCKIARLPVFEVVVRKRKLSK
jgi:hypothetical protein